MFGIDQISWGQFSRFLVTSLLLWYFFVSIRAWLKEKGRNRKMLFEEDFSMPVLAEPATPVSVSSVEFPAELIPIRLSEDIRLPVSLYEETGIDDGYSIECFSQPDHPEMQKILEQVQFQQ